MATASTPEEPTKKIQWTKLVHNISLVLCILSGVLVIGGLFGYWYERNSTVEAAKKIAKNEAERAVREVDQNLSKLKNTAQSIANDLSSGQLRDEEVPNKIKEEMDKNNQFFGLGAAYIPYAISRKTKLYIPNYYRKDNQLIFNSQSSYDYTDPKYEWFNRPLKEGGIWLEPFYGESTAKVLTEYGTPFYRLDPTTKQKKPIGVVYADYSIDDLKGMMNSLQLGHTGYAYILSKKGTVISHPIKSYTVNPPKNISQIAKIIGDPQLKLLGEKAMKGESGMMEIQGTKNGKDSWVFYQEIPTTGWTMVVVAFKDDFFVDVEKEEKIINLILISLISWGLFLSIVIFRPEKGRHKRIWAVTCSYSFLCTAGIVYKWYVSNTEKPYIKSNESTVILASESGTNQFLNRREQLLNKSVAQKPIYIPTGVMVQTLEFNTANNVTITGYIWQVYTKGIHDNVDQGFILPEGISNKIVESYRRKEGNKEVVGWYFEAKLRQNFDYNRYPLDYKDVSIRIWAKDFDKNVILVPDYRAYELINPVSLPGIEEDFVLSGWELEASFFQYYLNSYNSNFGITNYTGQKNFPELYFTVILRRSLLPIFISNLIPVGVVIFLLFAVLHLTRSKNDGVGVHGFSALSGVQTSSGLLFIILLNQINLRNSITAMGIIYLEYFYFISYLMIILVIVNILLYILYGKFRLVQHQDNFIPRALYWPTLLTTLLIITLRVF